MSKPIFDVILIVFAILWFSGATRDIFRTLRGRQHSRLPIATMGALGLVGFAGFFGAAFAAEGIFKFPNSFEWPAGYVSGICTTPDGNFVVPLEPPGRVQIYDAHWRFLRGWHANALRGPFKVACSTAGHVDVYAGPGRQHYVFADNGNLLSATPYAEGEEPPLTDEPYIVVPTSSIGWIFSSPFISWAVGVAGFAGMALIRKLQGRRGGACPAPTTE